MAHRTYYPVEGRRSEEKLLTSKLVGAGAADMVVADAATGGEIVSATRTGAGVFTIVFRDSYPELKSIVGLNFGPRATDGLKASFSAIDVTAKTGTLQVEVNTTDTDPAAGDTLYITWLVRNSGRNA